MVTNSIDEAPLGHFELQFSAGRNGKTLSTELLGGQVEPVLAALVMRRPGASSPSIQFAYDNHSQ